MANFSVWIETTRAGNFQIRVRDKNGKNSTPYTVNKMDRMILDVPLSPECPDGKRTFSGKSLANRLADDVRDKYFKGQLGEVDLSLSIEKLLETWLMERLASKLSLHTITHNRTSINTFIRDNNLNSLLDITNQVIKDWRLAMFRANLHNETIRGRLADVRNFLNWLVENGKLKVSPFGKKIIPQKKANQPKFYTPEEWLALDNALSQSHRPTRIVCTLAHSAGLRKKEALEAMWEDIFWEDGGIPKLNLRMETVKGGKRGRTVPLTPDIMVLLGSLTSGYLVDLPIQYPKDAQRQYNYRRSVIDHHFPVAHKLSGIKKGLHIHGLRHTFAKNYLQSGSGNLKSLADILGHSTTKTTEIYSQFEQSFHDKGMMKMYEYSQVQKTLAGKNVVPLVLQGDSRDDAGNLYETQRYELIHTDLLKPENKLDSERILDKKSALGR